LLGLSYNSGNILKISRNVWVSYTHTSPFCYDSSIYRSRFKKVSERNENGCLDICNGSKYNVVIESFAPQINP